MKVGRESPAGEEARIAAVREAIGPDVHLMLDANNAWPDLPTAMSYLERLEPYRPYWIEEPFSPDDIDNHARLAKATRVTVATGEIEAGRWRFKALLDAGAAGLLLAASQRALEDAMRQVALATVHELVGELVERQGRTGELLGVLGLARNRLTSRHA
jgi:L-alanine-DL-glutamate epimerase-like enolase superfamily enzyme